MNAHISETVPENQTVLVNPPVSEQEEGEELVLRLSKPFHFEGKEYTEVDLHGLEDVSAADLCKVSKQAKKETGADPIPEMSLPYAIYMAARVTGLPVEFFQRLTRELPVYDGC